MRLLPLFLGLFISFSVVGQKTITKEEANALGSLSIFYNGRIAVLDSYAKDFCRKIYGQSTYKDLDAVQVLSGWLFFPEEWQNEPFFKIKSKQLQQKLGVKKYAKLTDFLGNAETYQLFRWGGGYDPHNVAIKEAIEKISLIRALHTGESLKIFPQKSQWYAQNDDLSLADANDTLFISNVFQLLYESVGEQNHAQILEIIHKISLFQKSRAEKGSIDDKKVRIELIYNSFNIVNVLFKIHLSAGILLVFFYIFFMQKGKKTTWISGVNRCILLICCVLLTLYLAIRWYLSSHIPLSNGYETMLFLSWVIVLICIVLAKKSPLLSLGGLVISGFTLLVASLNFMNPQIGNLMPVLASPWMSIHVSLVMIAYAVFTFTFINSLIYIALRIFTKGETPQMAQLQTISQTLLLLGVGFLSIGIFTGAVWANITWGRYWGWDPKEVWALITLIVYSMPLHGKILSFFQKPIFFHIFLIFAFFCVLMTYFGVNYLLGGMHSYR
ncbi:MAG: cytochrome c biogenesis protein CcsA [Bacteroidales bacterium]|nr:cytochrome c biogenesis protein CcsA [Bacteroidales bacterium]